MNIATKNIGKLFAALVITALSFCLIGCQKELTGKEAVDKYESIEAVEVFKNEAASDLVEIIDIVGEITDSKSRDTKLELYEDLLKKQVEVDRVCDDLITMKDYPKACEELHAQLVTSAENIKKAADCFERTGFYDMQENINTGTKRAKEADTYTDNAVDAAERYNELKEEMMKQE